MITGKNYIGNTLSAKGTITFKTFNPQLNSENTTIFSEATLLEVELAVELATDAYESFKMFSGKERALFLNAVADEILNLGDALIEIYCSESGLPVGRAQIERTRTIGQLRSFAKLVEEGSWVAASIDTADPDRVPIAKPDVRKMMVPLGPVVVFGASNFPLAYSTAGGDSAAAFAAGCPVIVKSHPMHAGTGELVAMAVLKAAASTGMPNGIFSNINSSGIEVGAQLVSHPGVKAVGFTGSIKGGRALFDLASKREEPIPVFAEMGSVNPVVILPNALKNRGVDLGKVYAGSITLGTGQFCTNPGLILGLKGKELSAFVNSLSEEILKIDPTCMLHPNILGAYKMNKEKAVSQNNTYLVANYSSEIKDNYAQHGILAVDGDVFLKNSTLHQEIFGPFSIVVQCASVAQLEIIISNLEGQLTGTLIADNKEESAYSKLIAALQNRVGRLIFNGVPTGVEVCPSMHHGGPYPASTDSRFTAVGIHSIKRWVRPMSYQDWPNELLPEELKNENTLEISRLINGAFTTNKI
jgi:alpha-ketoglutaric semialdehyde dehydrogenase